MKITFVAGHVDLAGGIRVLALHAEELQRLGHEVVVVSVPRRRPRWTRAVRSVLEGRGWPRLQRVAPSHLDGRGIEHRVLPETRPVRDEDVPDGDVVIATWWETAEWVAALSPRKGAKVHFIQHDEVVFEGQPTERVRATWKLPMHRVAVAPWLVDRVREVAGDEHVALVPNAVDQARFDAPPRGRRPVPRVGTMYARQPFKGCDIALEAVRRARQDVPGLGLLCFGAEPPSAPLPLPADHEFVLRPRQDELPGLYARCDAWLFASRCEGFGLPVLEAMACRTPVIGTPTGAAPRMLADGGGLLVGHEDPDEMARAIVEIVRMPEPDWRRMSAAARQAVMGHTWEEATRLLQAALLEATRAAPQQTARAAGANA